MNTAGDACEDVNECDTNNGGCDVNATCANEVGSFTCNCNSGWIGNGVDCIQDVCSLCDPSATCDNVNCNCPSD